MQQKRFDSLSFLSRQYLPGLSDSTFEGFLDLSRILLDPKSTKAIDVSDDQKNKCQRLFAQHISDYRKMAIGGDKEGLIDVFPLIRLK